MTQSVSVRSCLFFLLLAIQKATPGYSSRRGAGADNFLFDYGVKNGMRAFENDFANYNLLAMPLFRQEFNASTRWLGGMNAAAVR